MKPDEIRKLLGGYATGTLTEAERKELFAAALDDQELFDALADEEALRALLDDPSYRRELAAALADTEPSMSEKLAAWWRRPLPIALAGAVAVMAVVIITLMPRPKTTHEVALSRPPVAGQSAPEAKSKSLAVEEPAEPRSNMDQGTLSSEVTLADEVAEAEPQQTARPARRAANEFEGKVEEADAPAPKVAGMAGAPPETEETVRDAATLEALSQMPSAGLLEQAVGGVKLVTRPLQQAAETPSEPQPAPAPEAEPPAKAKEEQPVLAEVPSSVRERDTAARPRQLGFGMRRALPSAMSLGITVERRGGDGSFIRVPEGVGVTRDDVVRLRVQAPASGYIYAIDQTSPESNRLIFTGEAPEAGTLTVPNTGGLAPPAEPGERRLSVVFSREPLELETLESAEAAKGSRAETSVEIVLEYLQ